MDSLRGALAALVTGVAVALVIVAVAILPFLNPPWVAFAQARAQADAWTGWTTVQLATVTDQVLADLVIGPPDFDATLDGAPVLNENERSHMRDVRGVFAAFFVLAAGAALLLGVLFLASRGPEARGRFWRRLERSGLVVAGVTLIGGLGGVLLFDQAFMLFHVIFFPGGNYLFDPSTERLVQLFPQQFWVDSTIGVGAVVVLLGLATAWVGRRRRRVAERLAAGGGVAA
jgi:integral membrane protein (TIGR01906 family)